MSRKLKALAALNILGWVVAVPLLLFAVVDPFVDFPRLPDRLDGGRGGTVHLDEPASGVGRRLARAPRRDDPVRAAREALARFAPGSAGTVALLPGLAAGGGGPSISARDRAILVAELRSRAGRTRPLGSPPSSRGLASPPVPAAPPAVVAPPAPGSPGAPVNAPAPAPVSDDAAPPARAEPPMPETAQAPESPPGEPEGQDSASPPADEPAPAPPTEPPAGEPPAPEPPAPPAPPAGEHPPPPEPPPPPADEPPAPEIPEPPEDPPEDPEQKAPIPPAVKPPHEDIPQPDAPAGPPPTG